MFEETLDGQETKIPERVGFGPRFAAMLIDMLIIFTLIPLISWIFLSSGMSEMLIQKGFEALSSNEELISMLEEQMGEYFNLYLTALGLASTLAILYNLIEGFTGASPGKMILGLQIAHEDARKGDFNLYMIRWLVKNSSSVLSILYLALSVSILSIIASIFNTVIFVGCFMVLSERKMALHDIIAKTAVYRKSEIREE